MSHDDQILQLHQERKRHTSVSSEYDDGRNVPGSAAHNALLALSSIAVSLLSQFYRVSSFFFLS